MGTDIHLSAEVARYDGNGNQIGWDHLPGPVVQCWSCKDHRPGFLIVRGGVDVGCEVACRSCTTTGADCEDEWDRNYFASRYVEPGKTRDHWYSDRNYMVFAMLAGVRNGTGFAGTPTHSPIVPVSDLRGVPDDVTAETIAILSDEHSASWLMLDELLDYDWAQPIERDGSVTAATDRTSEFVERMKMLAAEAGERLTRIVFDFDS